MRYRKPQTKRSAVLTVMLCAVAVGVLTAIANLIARVAPFPLPFLVWVAGFGLAARIGILAVLGAERHN